MASTAAFALVGWGLTYLLHSTILLAFAWLLTRLLSRDRVALKEAVWRLALVGALVTASLQPVLGVEPLAPRIALLAGEAAGVAAGAVSAGGASVAVAEASPVIRFGGPVLVLGVSSNLAAWLLVTWALTATFALALVGMRSRRLRRRLCRRPVVEGAALTMLEELGEVAGLRGRPRLTVSAALTSPAVLGPREICLPDSVLRGMETPRVRAILAHEVAHLRRKDPLWTWVTSAVVAVFPFQPLNRVVRRELRGLAELGSDDWARAVTGEPLALARALLDVADRVENMRPGPVPSLSLVTSAMESRILRLLEDGRAVPAGRSILLAGAVALLGTIWMMPGFTVGGGSDGWMPAQPTPITTKRMAERETTPLEIRAVDPAGVFTVSLLDGRVVGASIEGVPVPDDRLVQTADSLRFLGGDGQALFSIRVRPEGGISWEARPADWRASEMEST